LGEVVRKTSGLSADKFAEKYLLNPLGITDHRWKSYPDGTVDTGGGLYLIPRDMAKIGYMMLKNGRWIGKQIVSEEWVSESTKAHVQQTGTIILASDYGYQWHHGKGRISNQSIKTFFASGLGGQYIFVLPTLDLVVVFTSKHKDSSGIIFGQLMLANYIIPAVLPTAPPRKTIKLNQKIVDKYLGDYESKEINEKLTVLKEGETLYIQHWNGEKGRLFPETESISYVTSKELGDLQFTFIRDKKGEIRYFIASLGFLGFRFDKMK
jgi:CubicO group peptidase (beta-lactamase class C family)